MYVLKRSVYFIRSWINQLEPRPAVKTLILFFMGFFNYVRFMGEEYRLKFEPKVLETWNFAQTVPFISSLQKYLNTMICQQICC